jgi:hypothetical protein
VADFLGLKPDLFFDGNGAVLLPVRLDAIPEALAPRIVTPQADARPIAPILTTGLRDVGEPLLRPALVPAFGLVTPGAVARILSTKGSPGEDLLSPRTVLGSGQNPDAAAFARVFTSRPANDVEPRLAPAIIPGSGAVPTPPTPTPPPPAIVPPASSGGGGGGGGMLIDPRCEPRFVAYDDDDDDEGPNDDNDDDPMFEDHGRWIVEPPWDCPPKLPRPRYVEQAYRPARPAKIGPPPIKATPEPAFAPNRNRVVMGRAAPTAPLALPTRRTSQPAAPAGHAPPALTLSQLQAAATLWQLWKRFFKP